MKSLGDEIRKRAEELDPLKQSRNFKGIWIPKEIWFDKELSLQEKLLFMEVDSLDTDKLGCIASNAYFAKFFGVSERQIQKHLRALKNKKYIREDMFDGRRRLLRSNLQITRRNKINKNRVRW